MDWSTTITNENLKDFAENAYSDQYPEELLELARNSSISNDICHRECTLEEIEVED